MATEFKFRPPKTYATEDNARKAINKLIDLIAPEHSKSIRFMIVESDSRYAPVVIHSNGHAGHFCGHGFTVTGY